MFNFDAFLETLKNDLKEFAADFGEDVKEELIADGTAFARKAKADIEKWSLQLANGDLSESDFKFLLKGKKDLAEMEMLKQKGLAQARIDRLKQGLLATVVGSAAKLVRPTG